MIFLLILFPACNPGPSAPPGGVFEAGGLFASRVPTLEHTIQVTNTTARPVTILGETHSCVCTAVELEKGTLKPGQSVPLRLRIQVARGRSDPAIQCRVRTDHPDFPEWVYEVRYGTFPDSRVEPATIVLGAYPGEDRGAEAAADPPPTAWLEIYRKADVPVAAPPRLDGGCPGLDVRLGREPETEDLPGGVRLSRYPLALSIAAPKGGSTSALRTLTFRLDDGTTCSANVSWRVVGDLEASPSPLHFGFVAPAEGPISRSVILRSTRGRDFRLIGAESDSSAVEAVAAKPDSSAPLQKLEFTFKPSNAPARIASGRVRLHTDLPGDPPCEVEWSAFVDRKDEPTTAIPSHEPRSQEEE